MFGLSLRRLNPFYTRPISSKEVKRKNEMLMEMRSLHDRTLAASKRLMSILGAGLTTDEKINKAFDLLGIIYLCRRWFKAHWKMLNEMRFRDHLISDATFDKHLSYYQRVYDISRDYGMALYHDLMLRGLSTRKEKWRYVAKLRRSSDL